MHFSVTALFALCLAVMALAQSVEIGTPANGATVHAGKKLLVEVVRPDSLEGSIEVAVVISFLSCSNGNCPPSNAQLGTVLYNGPYNPQFPNPNPSHLQPNQNFTVTIPSSAPKGKAQLAVTHFSLFGAGPSANTQFLDVTLNVA